MKRSLAFGLIVVLAGCAGPAAVERMVAPSQGALSAPLTSQVVLEPGNVTFNSLATGERVVIGRAEFEEALSISLANAGLLATSNGRYGLEAIPRDLQYQRDQSGFWELVVGAVIDYRVTDLRTGDVLLDETIATSGSSDESAFGAETLLYAAERAIGANFDALIRQLAELQPQ